jgi:hypothetical protein
MPLGKIMEIGTKKRENHAFSWENHTFSWETHGTRMKLPTATDGTWHKNRTIN